MKAMIKKNKKNQNLRTVKFEDMTEGQFMALRAALEAWNTPVAKDVLGSLDRAVEDV